MAVAPICECHGVPMAWNKAKTLAGGYWRCRVKRLESVRRWEKQNLKRHREGDTKRKRRRRQRLREAGLCIECGGPLCSQALCWDCLNRLEELGALTL